MNVGVKVRQILFESLLDDGDNRKNWEKLCSSRRPLVPFVGAGISAWCYPTWNALLKSIVEKIYSPECAEIVEDALSCEKNPKLEDIAAKGHTFRWMEEIAECIFDTDMDKYKNYENTFKPCESGSDKEDSVLKRLRRYVGRESNKKVDAVNELYMAFSEEKLKEKGRVPEYQSLFCKLFQDVLVTTNYDKALESCYSSILSYSYKDLDKSCSGSESWLFRAIKEKLRISSQRMEGRENLLPEITVPGMPMLLKVHGSIEQAEDIALSWSGYEQAYAGEMPKLFGEIVRNSTMIFLGYGMREDRILEQLNEIQNKDLYAILPKNEDKKQKKLLEQYGISPIYYDKKLLKGLLPDGIQGEESHHEFFLGLILENLTRRRMFYPKTLEELWDEDRFCTYDSQDFEAENRKMNHVEQILARQNQQIERLNQKKRKEWLQDGDPQFVHTEQAHQILNLLNTSVECPLVAVTGDVGTGKSMLCKSIQGLNESSRDPMRFFYISMDTCRSWETFCIRLCESMNLIITDIPEEQGWMDIAEQIATRCGAYWRSVLILDQLEAPDSTKNNLKLWETIKNILRYWKEKHVRVIVVCQSYLDGISCYTWHIQQLQKDEARKVFFSACQSIQNKGVSGRDWRTVNAWFEKYEFKASEVRLLGKYVDSKGGLAGILEEWDIYHETGEELGKTLARILWNNLLADHGYFDKMENGQLEDCRTIEKNILWIWGILGKYPGNFPHQFFESALEKADKGKADEGNVNKKDDENAYKDKDLSLKTLIYMKNYGLCEEIVDERNNNILENLIVCVRDNFVSGLDKSLVEKYDSFLDNFHSKGEGMMWFRGYSMHSYERSLLEYVREILDEKNESETKDDKKTMADSVEDILNLLSTIGEKVRDSKLRAKNPKLDVILHYEIKTIIQLLHACLIDEEFVRTGSSEFKARILGIGADFYTYYQYAPDYAYPLVKLLIEKIETRKKEKEESKDWDISIVRLSKILGDIYRFFGKKDKSLQSYQKALKLCDDLILSEEKDAQQGIRHIKAGIMIAMNYYDYSDELQEKAKRVYSSNDKSGLAFYNQRTAEVKLDQCGESKLDAKAQFAEMKPYYMKALRLFKAFEQENGENRKEDSTKVAYMLKCIGDFIVGFRETIWNEGNMVSYSMEHARLEITSNKMNGGEQKCDIVGVGWFYAAADFYLQSFMDYCSHINWRGLVNVVQAMGTCMRNKERGKKRSRRSDVENVYSMAEECFRWLGDVRGLADTLDYFGYYYNDIEGEKVTEENVVFKYMALGKWRESKRVWEQQGNRDKMDRISKVIQGMEKRLEEYEKSSKTAEKAEEPVEVKRRWQNGRQRKNFTGHKGKQQ